MDPNRGVGPKMVPKVFLKMVPKMVEKDQKLAKWQKRTYIELFFAPGFALALSKRSKSF